MKEQYQKPKAVKVEFDYEEQLTASGKTNRKEKNCDIVVTSKKNCSISTYSLEFAPITETEDYVVEEPVVELPGEEVYEEAVPTTPSVED